MIEWSGCYNTAPKDIIPPEGFNHPARMRVKLIENILAFGEGEGCWKPGDHLIDPMAGVGMTAAIACRAGYNVSSVELESYFYDVIAGCRCSGMTKLDWVRGLGRWRKLTCRERTIHWCPRCLECAGKPRQSESLPFFEQLLPSPSYAKNSGIVPSSLAHHYQGTIDLINRIREVNSNTGKAVAYFGDARYFLARYLTEPNGFDGALFSPPYFGSLASDDPDKRGGLYRDPKRRKDRTLTATYGESPGQIGVMREGLHDEICGGIETLGEVDVDGLDGYWAAMALVYRGLAKVLKPGALTAIVVRHLVQKKEVVDFPGKTLRLLKAIGFEFIEEAHALFMETSHVGYDIEGNEITKTVEKKTFHRLNYERKFPENRIDYETVLFVRNKK